MQSENSPVSRLVSVFNKSSKPKTYAQISSSSLVSKQVTKNILRLGRDKIFVQKDGWSLKDGITSQDVKRFISVHQTDIDFFLEEWRSSKKTKSKSPKTLGVLNLQRKGKLTPLSIKEDEVQRPKGGGLTKGKVKLYKGPQGAYWTDPNYKKKEY